jgi:NADH-quinone oxidoreductase subunit J
MVLFLFVIMLLNLNRATDAAQSLRVQTVAAVTAGLMLVSLAVAVRGVDVPVSSTLTVGTVGRLGQVLFDQYMVPFELSSVLFLAAIVGVVVVSKKRLRDENP